MKVYELYYKGMYGVSLRIVGDAMEAEDIMQESFLTAFNHLKTTDLTVSFGGWLKKIVINKSLDAIRKRKAFFEQVENLPDVPDEPRGEEENNLTTEQKVTQIKRAIDLLPDKYRIILVLNLLEGYDHEEISEILDIQPSTSRAQLSRGKKLLINIINSNGNE